jgi:hypothetical protein
MAAWLSSRFSWMPVLNREGFARHRQIVTIWRHFSFLIDRARFTIVLAGVVLVMPDTTISLRMRH